MAYSVRIAIRKSNGMAKVLNIFDSIVQVAQRYAVLCGVTNRQAPNFSVWLKILRCACHSLNYWFIHRLSESVSECVSEWVSQSVSESLSQLLEQTTDEPTDQWIYQAITQSIKQSANQSAD